VERGELMRTFIDENSAQGETLNGKPISAFYASSTGGATQDVRTSGTDCLLFRRSGSLEPRYQH
jgi:peptidoglycan hydrolase-like amidase